jgi:hypothetical protein
MRRIGQFTVRRIYGEIEIRNMDRGGKRRCFVWIIIRKSAAANCRVIPADMQVVDVLNEISYGSAS